MISVEDLIDELYDLTRADDPVVIATEATQLIESTRVQMFLHQWRAAAVADAHYLNDVPMRQIAKECHKTPQAISNWLDEYGPKLYVAVVKDPDTGRFTFRLVPVEREYTRITKARIRQYRNHPDRVLVPATRNLLDPDQPTGVKIDTDPQALWDELS